MTVTALFRDFLILKKAKLKFEENWKKVHSSDVKWNGDFLMHYTIEVVGRDNSRCWRFLTPRKVFAWDETDEGYRYWANISDDWCVFIRNNINKITIDKMSKGIKL